MKAYSIVKIDQKKVEAVLRSIGNKDCFPAYRHMWSKKTPTVGYCYKLCEVVSYHLKRNNIPHKVFQIKTESVNHWFIRLADNTLVELTSLKGLPYELGKGRAFFPCATETKMSLIAERLALELGIL